MSGIRINSLEIQNVKRVKIVKLDIRDNSLVVIGGKNGQGKTSILDAICFCLGGERFRPSNLKREGSVADAEIRIELSNGLIVERKGKNASLKVIDPEGGKSGQQLVNEFVSQLALDLPRFLNANNSDKAKTLLDILGIGDELARLEREEGKAYNERHAVGQIADQKKKFALEQPCYDEVPAEPITAAGLLKEQSVILAHNAENLRKRNNITQVEQACKGVKQEVDSLKGRIADLQGQLDKKGDELYRAEKDLATAQMSAQDLVDKSTAEIEAKINEIEETNAKIRANKDKSKAEDDAAGFQADYDRLTEKIEGVRAQRLKLLESADLPLPGLSVLEGELVFNGMKWDCMSGADQLRIGTAIVRKVNPNCGFVLLDKLEQMDVETLQEFALWLTNEGLQAIATRVSTGDECSILIDDGSVVDDGRAESVYQALKPAKPVKPMFEEGKF